MLSKASAYMSGSDYWIVPPLETSHWTQTLNWYLNFQISKQRAHKPPEFAEALKDIIEDNELPFSSIETKNTQSLMISSHNRLPTDYVIEVPILDSIEAWFEEVLKISSKVNSKKFRIFLPQDVTEIQVLDFWSKKDVEASFVSGEESE